MFRDPIFYLILAAGAVAIYFLLSGSGIEVASLTAETNKLAQVFAAQLLLF